MVLVVVVVVVVEASSSRGDSSRGSSDCEYCECEIAISDGSDGDARGDGVSGICFGLRITTFCLVLGAGVGF